MSDIILILLGFLSGAIPFGFLAGKARGVDLRTQGSGNIGATNVFRCLGWQWGVPVFMLDMLKGFFPVSAVFILSEMRAFLLPPDVLATLAGLAAVLGHNFTPFLKFKGGKGIATSSGVLLALMPVSFGFTAAIWGGVFAVTRYVSIASLASAVALPVITAVFYTERLSLIIVSAVLGILAFIRHHSNIRRLYEGTEPKAGAGKT